MGVSVYAGVCADVDVDVDADRFFLITLHIRE